MPTPDTLRFVEGELNYLVPMAERPRYFAYDAGPDAPTNMAHEAHTVRIHDMRPISHEVTLDRHGFALVEQRTAVRDFWDEDEVHEVYIPEAAATTFTARCDGTPLTATRDAASGLVELPCEGVLIVEP